MHISEINNNSRKITFAANMSKIKPSNAQDAVIYIKGELSSQVNTIVDVVNKMHTALRKLTVQKNNPEAKNILEGLRASHGVGEVFETKAQGFVLAADENKNLILSSHGHNSLRIREQNSKTGTIENSLFINDKKIAKTDTRAEIPAKIEYLQQNEVNIPQFETNLQEQMDNIDFSLLKIRRELAKPEIQAEISRVDESLSIPVQILKPANTAPVKLETVTKPVVTRKESPAVARKIPLSASSISIIESRLKSSSVPAAAKSKPAQKVTVQKTEPEVKAKRTRGSSMRVLSNEDMNLVKDLKNEFNQVYNTLNSKQLSVNTRSLIKNGYEKIDKGLAGSRRLTFIGLGPNGANAGVNFATFQGYEFMQIRLTDKLGKVQDLIVNSQGKVTRTSVAFKDKLSLAMDSKTYTRQELDDIEFVPMLQRLKKELGEYNQYLEARLNKTSEWKERQYQPENIGSLANEKELINTLYEGYTKYKDTFKQVQFYKREQLLSEIGFETKRGNPSIIMRSVGENSENIHLSFPMFLGKRAAKIQLLGENDSVKKVFYILDDKLVRFDAEDIHSAIRDDRKLRYYSEEEIERFGVKKYLSVINEHLQKANETVESYKSGKSGLKRGRPAVKSSEAAESVKRQKQARINNNEILSQMQDQIDQLHLELNQGLNFLMANIIGDLSKYFREFEQSSNKKINELQDKLAQLLKGK